MGHENGGWMNEDQRASMKDSVRGSPICLQGTNLDSVRIEVLGETRALTIPLSLVIDLDAALKEVREIGHGLIVYKMAENHWLAECGGDFYGPGATPMQAIANMCRLREASPQYEYSKVAGRMMLKQGAT